MRYKKALLIYPPVGHYQRGEERCQADIESGSAINIREPLDLAVIGAILADAGMRPVIRDYPAENKGWKHFTNDLKDEKPDIVLISITEATLKEDLYALELAKKSNSNILTLAKGAVFSTYNDALLSKIDFSSLDIAFCGEAEFILKELLLSFENKMELSKVKGIAYKNNERICFTPKREFDKDLDSLPYPRRDLIINSLYIRPDSGQPQATIQASRGCPFKCIYCLSPIFSGCKVRTRSIKNILGEIEECINKYNIRNFFFRADTFTYNKKHVTELCRQIIESSLNINWVANSRVDTFDIETASWMKKSGCWLVAFGIESGNQEILDKIKKNTDNEKAEKAIEICKKTGLKTYGFFMIGFPWDNRDTIEDTIDLATRLELDFIEIHISTPYAGTELYDIATKLGLVDSPPSGYNYFSNPPAGTLYLSRQELIELRKKGLKRFYLSNKYIRKKIFSTRSPKEIINYLRYGLKLIKNLMRK